MDRSAGCICIGIDFSPRDAKTQIPVLYPICTAVLFLFYVKLLSRVFFCAFSFYEGTWDKCTL